MKRLTLLLLLVGAALVAALWPTDKPPRGVVPAPATPEVSATPRPLPALRTAEPELVPRLPPVAETDAPSLTEQGFAPAATETGWVQVAEEIVLDPNDSRYFRGLTEPEPAPDVVERESDDTAMDHILVLSPTELEDHGSDHGSETEEHADGQRVTWAPGVSRTEYDTAPPENLTATTPILPPLPADDPVMTATRVPVEPVPLWPGADTHTTEYR